MLYVGILDNWGCNLDEPVIPVGVFPDAETAWRNTLKIEFLQNIRRDGEEEEGGDKTARIAYIRLYHSLGTPGFCVTEEFKEELEEVRVAFLDPRFVFGYYAANVLEAPQYQRGAVLTMPSCEEAINTEIRNLIK